MPAWALVDIGLVAAAGVGIGAGAGAATAVDLEALVWTTGWMWSLRLHPSDLSVLTRGCEGWCQTNCGR